MIDELTIQSRIEEIRRDLRNKEMIGALMVLAVVLLTAIVFWREFIAGYEVPKAQQVAEVIIAFAILAGFLIFAFNTPVRIVHDALRQIPTVNTNWGSVKKLDDELDALEHYEHISRDWDNKRKDQYRNEAVENNFTEFKNEHDSMFRKIKQFSNPPGFWAEEHVAHYILKRDDTGRLLKLWLQEKQAYYDIVTKRMYPR